MTTDTPTRTGNRLLHALPDDLQDRLHSKTTRVSLERGDHVWEPNRVIDFVYFPLDCVTSIMAVDRQGHAVEAATIGNEGFVGLPVFLGADSSPGLAFTQLGGEAERLRSEEFQREARSDGPLRDVLDRYAQGFMTQVAQGTACNRLHTSQQRFARWLLGVQDRLQRDAFPLTHEFIAQTLGVRRATVTETAQAFQRAGVIEYHRGWLRVSDRQGLEAMTCECYRIVRDEYERLIGVSAG